MKRSRVCLPTVEIFRRQDQNKWLLTEFAGWEAICRFESLDCEIPIAEIYEDVKFELQPFPLPPPEVPQESLP